MKSDLNITKILIVMMSVGFFFVLPIVLITEFQRAGNIFPILTSFEGRVAGISTTSFGNSELLLPIINQHILLNSKSGVLLISGILLVGIAVILIIYLFKQQKKAKRKFTY